MKSLSPNSIEELLSTKVKAGKIKIQQSSTSKILLIINQRRDDFLIQRRFKNYFRHFFAVKRIDLYLFHAQLWVTDTEVPREGLFFPSSKLTT